MRGDGAPPLMMPVWWADGEISRAVSLRTRGTGRGHRRPARAARLGCSAGRRRPPRRPRATRARPPACAAVPQQRLDPGLGAVVARHVLVDQQLAEQDPHPDVRERPEGQDPARPGHERVDVGVLRLQLLDDRADRLVDERDPDGFLVGTSEGSVPDLRRVRQMICAAVTSSSAPNSFRNTCRGAPRRSQPRSGRRRPTPARSTRLLAGRRCRNGAGARSRRRRSGGSRGATRPRRAAASGRARVRASGRRGCRRRRRRARPARRRCIRSRSRGRSSYEERTPTTPRRRAKR